MKIVWSPVHEAEFLTFNTSINLYKIINCSDDDLVASNQGMQVSDSTYAIHIGTNSEIQYMKTLAWYPKHEDLDNLIAVGQANGKVTLTSFGQPNSSELVGKEFSPKHSRTCIYLAWNPVDSHLLAEGLERYRNDPCILIWDINYKSSSEMTASISERPRYSESNFVTKPLAELGPGETTGSLAWFHKDAKTFATGMNSKFIRIFDLRELSRYHLAAQTRNVYGICVDPKNEYRLASYHENQVSVWDVRSFDKPDLYASLWHGTRYDRVPDCVPSMRTYCLQELKMLTFQETKPIMKISWCPTRMGFLAALTKESSVVKLYDIRHTPMGADELEPSFIERNIQSSGQQVVSFSWHPAHENRMLTVTPTGQVRDHIVHERIPVMWSSQFHLTWACGKRLMDVQQDDDEDISQKMKKRVIAGYGAQSEVVEHNAHIVKNEPHLQGMWKWLSLIRQMADESKQGQIKSIIKRCYGIKTLLMLDSESNNCVSYVPWQESDSSNSHKQSMKQFISEERSRALRLCGWGTDRYNLDNLLDVLQSQGEITKAAAIALFNLKLGKSIDILSSSQQQPDGVNLSAVAMALAGFSDDRQTMWKKTCSALLTNLNDPYLKAMFSFLTSENNRFDDILIDHNVPVADRIGLACLYLSDLKLKDYLDKLSQKMKEDGNLDGLLLTGMTQDGIELLQNYVDKTGDIQTVSLAAVYVFPCDMSQNFKVVTWIESYRDLLDKWMLWHHRAGFDIFRHSSDTASAIRMNRPQAYVSCNFCGKSIACNTQAPFRLTSRCMNMGISNKPKITCCPGCRKPLPRCAVCLTNLGTPSGSNVYQKKNSADYKNKLSPLDDWFTWCQTCRHGGHASHIKSWFNEHSECPITGCECKCAMLDPIGRISPT